MVSHPCVSRPGRRLDQVRGDHQLPRIIKPRSRRKSTCNYHQVDALSCCTNHRVRIECALIIIPFCRYKWNAIYFWDNVLAILSTALGKFFRPGYKSVKPLRKAFRKHKVERVINWTKTLLFQRNN